MTLVVTVNGPESIWLLAHRRLSSEGAPSTRMLEVMRAGQSAKELNKGEHNPELARLPDKPDETLR